MLRIQKLVSCILIMTGLLVYDPSSVSAALYRWKNKKGQLHYSSSPPTTPVKNLEIKRNNKWYPYSPALETPEPEETPISKALVSYRKQNTVIIIQVTLNNTIERAFAVDTGASYTIISQEIAKTLNLTPNPSIPPITLQTANGRIQAPLVNLDSVTVGHLTSHNVTAAIHNFDDSSNIAGLLGLNFLNRFKLTVDSTRHQLTLEPIQAFSGYTTRDCVAAREWVARGQNLHDNSEQEASYYRRAISLCSDLVEAYYYLGTVYYHQKNYQQAIDVHLDIIRILPDDPQAHYRLGVLYMFERNFTLAKGEFQKTLQFDPDHKQAKKHLEQLKSY